MEVDRGLLEGVLRARLARRMGERGLLDQIDPRLLWSPLGVVDDSRPPVAMSPYPMPIDLWWRSGWDAGGPDVKPWEERMQRKIFGKPPLVSG